MHIYTITTSKCMKEKFTEQKGNRQIHNIVGYFKTFLSVADR